MLNWRFSDQFFGTAGKSHTRYSLSRRAIAASGRSVILSTPLDMAKLFDIKVSKYHAHMHVTTDVSLHVSRGSKLLSCVVRQQHFELTIHR